jgi:hypothetical protein
MPIQETKAINKEFTNNDLVNSFFNGTSFMLSDLYSSIECSNVEIFSLEPLKKVGTFKISK